LDGKKKKKKKKEEEEEKKKKKKEEEEEEKKKEKKKKKKKKEEEEEEEKLKRQVLAEEKVEIYCCVIRSRVGKRDFFGFRMWTVKKHSSRCSKMFTIMVQNECPIWTPSYSPYSKNLILQIVQGNCA
jgi:hypothetical protein